jgi:type II secretory pathway pseudopilin PulG
MTLIEIVIGVALVIILLGYYLFRRQVDKYREVDKAMKLQDEKDEAED